MKVERNLTVFAGAEPEYPHVVKDGENPDKDNKERKTIFAGDLQVNQTLQDRIQQRKEKAQQEAMKIVKDAWAGDKTLDRSMDESREHLRQLQEDNLYARTEINKVEKQRQELKEIYGVTDDTPYEETPLEYRSRLMELDKYAQHNQEVLWNNERDILEENAIIRETKIERLKKHLMTDAQEQADEVLEAASDEIVGMVMEEAKEHLDEEQAKREEKAEKIEEEKEKMEELQKKRDERQEELEELIENMPVDEMLELDQMKSDVRQEVQNIVNKMKLVAEDIKGAMVDANI